ncbi:hypothetical protein Scep_021533 [Stephania cephalantha]|uniref:Mitotic checkpoint protein BUB3.3 n=1 Tax=Stephania cephalantha TaxID=152367 RepID=A0AAP0F4I1_9MAGN
MKGTCLEIDIRDAISRVQFAPQSNNLLISSWDSTLRLYDVENGLLRLDASMEVALLGCCFQDETTAVSIGSDCCVRRHDLCSNIHTLLGNHDDLVTSVEYSEESCKSFYLKAATSSFKNTLLSCQSCWSTFLLCCIEIFD